MGSVDAYLNPDPSPASQNFGAVDPYTWGYSNEDGVVTAKKILNFSFNSGSGGTLVLGGTANGNGQMILRDATGGTIFTGDNLGHHYYNSGTEQVRVDALGFHAYNSSALEQIKVDFNGFHAFGTGGTANELVKVSTSGLQNYDNSGVEKARLDSGGLTVFSNVGVSLKQNSSSPNNFGIFGITSTGGTMTLAANNNNDMKVGALQGNVDIVAAGTIDCSSSVFQINGVTKSAIVNTSKGYRALYTNESPEVWFMDFYKDKADPLFIEVTEPPYHKIKCEDGWTQIWGKRKGFPVRFEDKTPQQFVQNNKFWSAATDISENTPTLLQELKERHNKKNSRE